jgi:hypothetical protein
MKRFQILATLGLLLFIAGCGPKTQTIYTAPLDVTGKQCVQRCEMDAQRAELWEELEYKDCLADEYRGQLRNFRRDIYHARKHDGRVPYRPRFYNDAEFTCSGLRGFSSKNLYDRCFQGCGGSIEIKLLEPIQKTAEPVDVQQSVENVVVPTSTIVVDGQPL